MRHAPIVVAGEALIDLVLAPDGALAGHPGGGPYNVARTIGRLEQPVAYLGALSDDAFGRRLRAGLAQDGVGLECAVATERPTTLAVAELDAAGAAAYRFYERGTSAPDLTPDAAAAALPRDLAAFYLGTLGLVFEPIGSTLEELVGRLGEEQLVALDPNVRPSVIDDAVPYRSRLARLCARADVLKASGEDLDWIDPGADAEGAARALLRGPGAVALVTLGAAGALVVTRSDTRAVTAPRVDVVDTIGAGDAFMGGFLAWWSQQGLGRRELHDLDAICDGARFAARVAAITCSRAGADPPRAAELS